MCQGSLRHHRDWCGGVYTVLSVCVLSRMSWLFSSLGCVALGGRGLGISKRGSTLILGRGGTRPAVIGEDGAFLGAQSTVPEW